ncbi:hypothetical protein KAW80_01875 [Candidatus Babeliales bacterium]|nr:hypothetical protein [Candidatus Babeliales bacterium]
MLSLIIAAHCSSLIKKLILIGGGPLEQDYAKTIGQVRLSRLSDEGATVCY